MADSAETVKLGMTASSLVAKTPAATLVMRLLEGRFPDYNMVVPKENHKHVMAGRKELLEALKRIATMSSDDYKAVKFRIEAGRLTISSMTPELGKAEEGLEVEYDGEVLESGFNPRFFIEALSALSSEKVKISFNEASTPALLSGAEDPGYSGVIMSMKI
jgi:DNA polymerase-3 subunit beta